MHKISVLLLAGASTLWPMAATAQVVNTSAVAPGTATSADTDTPKSDSGGIQDIVVTARRTSESAQSVPLAITVLSGAKLKDANVNDIADVARLTPNFTVLTAPADATSVLLTIRGQSQQDSILTTDSPIGVYVDGVNYTAYPI